MDAKTQSRLSRGAQRTSDLLKFFVKRSPDELKRQSLHFLCHVQVLLLPLSVLKRPQRFAPGLTRPRAAPCLTRTRNRRA